MVIQSQCDLKRHYILARLLRNLPFARHVSFVLAYCLEVGHVASLPYSMQYYGPGPSSPRNTTWLSERTPDRLDAENAQSPIARPFMELFEQNLHSHPTASQTIQYLTLPQREKLVSETLASTKVSPPCPLSMGNSTNFVVAFLSPAHD